MTPFILFRNFGKQTILLKSSKKDSTVIIRLKMGVWSKSLQHIPKVFLAYSIDIENLKSKNNLIF